ncbi:beta-mannosidase-like [Diaphorina citri]|uniref:beta-mannosidase n=1 Tax=Diaphorina citri TaxID=121845 RepID=A0A3Q0IJF3_DIACI|nr:beta-mannosidase-like [Diaphorina citri]
MGWHLLALVLSAISIVRGNIAVIDLGGSHWTVTSENKSISTEATVPGGIYSDLRRGNILKEDVYYRDNDLKYRWVSKTGWTYSTEFEEEDVYYRDNDLKYRWVSKTGWTYSTEFEVTDKNFLALPNQFLVFHGVDTIATIYLNDKELGKTDNMFVRYRFDVKDKLQMSSHAVLSYLIVWYNFCCLQNVEFRAHTCVIKIDENRKSVELEGYHVARIRDILTDITYHEDLKSWHLSVRVILEAGLSQAVVKAKLTAELAVGKKPLRVDSLVNAEPSHGEIEVVSTLMVLASEVELWWPNGYGEQPLYNLQITLASGVEMSTKSIKIGFRTVELIQDHVDPNHLEKGRYFYFEVNKVPIYSKGSNLIPVDVLPERSNNESTIRDLLVSTKEANMNMLRVWGGGVYMSDYFYETCDELGILIWQDMMFACNNYPATPTFLQSVRSEISQTVRRAVVKAKLTAELAVGKKPLRVDSLVNAEPGHGEIEVVSTLMVPATLAERELNTHNYDYYQNLWDPSTAPKSRFCSEFGIQSLPQLSTFQKVATEADLASWRTPFFDSRQHLAGGTGILESSVGHQFEIGNLTLEYFAYLSQVRL